MDGQSVREANRGIEKSKQAKKYYLSARGIRRPRRKFVTAEDFSSTGIEAMIFAKFATANESSSDGTGSETKVSSSAVMGRKEKPVKKFVSTAATQIVKVGRKVVSFNVLSPPSIPDSSSRCPLKTYLCCDYNTVKGCKFGDKCHFAHGKCELGKPFYFTCDDNDPCAMASGRFDGQPGGLFTQRPSYITRDPFTAKIFVDASVTGALIGNDDLNRDLREMECTPSIQDHSSSPDLKCVELQGMFDQLQIISSVILEVIGRSVEHEKKKSIGHGAPTGSIGDGAPAGSIHGGAPTESIQGGVPAGSIPRT